MTDHNGTAADALVEMAVEWPALDGLVEEVSPRDLAVWLAQWRRDAAPSASEGGPLSALVAESFSVDGSGTPLEFLDWFMDWRGRSISALVDAGHAQRLAGLPVRAGLVAMLNEFQEDIGPLGVERAEMAIEHLEIRGYAAEAARRPAAELLGLLHEAASIPVPSDIRTRVNRELVVEAAAANVVEWRALAQAEPAPEYAPAP